jgi:Protein of unknown function (DUF3551)
METIMTRILAVGTLLAACLAGSSAFAQGSYQHHTVCLISGPDKECAYDSIEQCQASKRGNTDSCVMNTQPGNHPPE